MGNEFEDLKHLAEMLEKGEVTKAEYESIKADLLADMGSNEPTQTESIQPSANRQTEAVTEKSAMDDQIRWWLVGTGALMAVGHAWHLRRRREWLRRSSPRRWLRRCRRRAVAALLLAGRRTG